MTALAQVAAESGPKLKEFLAAKSVRKVLFIDDGFEPLEQIEPTVEEQNELWTAIEADNEALSTASAEGLSQSEALTGDVIAAFLNRTENDPLRRLAETSPYVVSHRNKTQLLRGAIEYLVSLGTTVLTSGRDDWEEKLDDVSIVFLDWRLGPESEGSDPIQQAMQVASKIHGGQSSARPMIVLISSERNVKEKARQFSQESGLISGLFDAMPKEWLSDQANVDLQMTILCAHLEKGHVVQNFVDAVSNRTKDAADTFVSKIRNLTLSDYANLQHFALREDGHPLGDYLIQLLAGVWIDTLFRGELREPLRALDKADFESLPSLVEPSEVLNDLYNAAVFDTHISNFERHPHAAEPQIGQAKRLALSLGDIVVEQENRMASKVYMVINPQCDLAESPRDKRRIDDCLSVLLVPGELRPVGAPECSQSNETAKTPCYIVDGAKFRIHWYGKKQVAIPYIEFPEWLDKKPRERKARMRTTFALSVQAAVRSQLTRIGLPVAPPMYAPIEAEVRYARMGQWAGMAEPLTLRRLFMDGDSTPDQVVLTHEYMTRLCKVVQEGIGPLAASGEQGDAEKAATIKRALADPAKLEELARPFPVPDNPQKFLGGAVVVCRKGKPPRPDHDKRLIVCLMLPDKEITS
jgi:hypothetical protein